VRLHAREVPDGVELVVSDTGPGIPADVLSRLFDPFFSTRSDGMCMGLAISRTLVDGMGGRIEAGNAIGGGAMFRVTWRRSVT
jgi:signal transduction histidine kinase